MQLYLSKTDGLIVLFSRRNKVCNGGHRLRTGVAIRSNLVVAQKNDGLRARNFPTGCGLVRRKCMTHQLCGQRSRWPPAAIKAKKRKI